MTWSTSIIDAPNIQTTTTEAITRYVATTGSDANPGTEAAPFLTIQAALNSLPRVLKHPVIINVGAGNFTGAIISGFQDGGSSNDVSGSYLRIVGTLTQVTAATGSASGTLTSGTAGGTTAFGTVTVDSAGWTVDDFQNKLLHVTSGGNADTYFVIRENTADTLTICGRFSSSSFAGSSFEIVESATIIANPVYVPATATTSTGTAKYGFILKGNTFSSYKDTIVSGSPRDLTIENFKISISGGGRGCLAYGPGETALIRCSIISNNTTVRGGAIYLDTCYIYTSTTNQTSILGGNDGILMVRRCRVVGGNHAIITSSSVNYNIFETAISGFVTTGIVCGQVNTGQNVQSVYIDGGGVVTTVGISSGDFPFAGVFISKTIINNCAKGIAAEQAGVAFTAQQVNGSGNTIALSLAKGGRIQVDVNSGITGTTEVSIDGAATDLATMRAASPKVIRDANYGTMIYE